MRKFIVGLVVGGLLAVTAPAMAQQLIPQGGIGDPLTLATSGVLIPFLGGSDVSLLEVASPVGDNGGLHMFFFDDTCTRIGDSVGLPLTTNDIGFIQVPTVVPSAKAGLITIGSADPSGFELRPLENPIHSRVYVFNTTSARSRVLEPIILDTAEYSSDRFQLIAPHTWSPLRTAATFFAPQETSTVETRLLLICPSTNIQNPDPKKVSAFNPTFFPQIRVGPIDPTTLQQAPGLAPKFVDDMLRARIYDTNEVFLRDVHTGCSCVRSAEVTDISNVYSAAEAALGTYTEIEANNLNSGNFDFAFTGYKATATVNSPVNNFVGRFSNGSRDSIQGNLTSTR